MGTDQTDEWESEISRRQGPKFKTQLKVIEEGLDMVDITFDEPTISQPIKKKIPVSEREVIVIELPKKRNNNKNNSKLF
jgi:hypothetical protein